MKRREIIKLLNKKFFFYKVNYKELQFDDFKTGYNIIKERVVTDWENLNIDWFVAYVTKDDDILSNLCKIVMSLNELGVVMNLNILKDILLKYPILDSLLSSLFKNKEVTSEDIVNISTNDVIREILFSYVTIKGMYKEEESNRSILSKEEIIKYFSIIEEINFALSKDIPIEKIKELEKRYDYYRNLIITSNLPLVSSIADAYIGRGLELADLVQEGSIGLMKAFERYDYHLDYCFSTYATWWIRQAITNAIYRLGRPIRIPTYLYEDINRVTTARNNLVMNKGSVDIPSIAKASKLSVNKVENIINLPQVTASLDDNLFEEDDDIILGGCFASEEDTEKIVIDSMLSDYLNEVISKRLNDREEFIVRMRFGFADNANDNPLFTSSHTLKEIGTVCGLSHESVRVILSRSLKKLNNDKTKKYLEGYIEDIVGYNRVYLKEILGATEDEMTYIQENIDYDSKYYSILAKYYGPTFRLPRNADAVIPRLDYANLSYGMKKLQELLDGYRSSNRMRKRVIVK